jgi:hypothetical protein
MDATKGNKLIALFMGAKFLRNQDFINPDKINESFSFLGGQGNWRLLKDPSWHSYKEYQLLYHTDWDWLMPVVEHIERLGFASVIEKVAWEQSVIHRVWFTNLNGAHYELASVRHESKITAVWLAVVAFIEWYNDQKK